MKSAGQILLLILLLAVGRAWAGDLAMADNPYATVVQRNIFGLLPIPTNDPAAQAPPADPPPKITPNGIMSIFGKLQVLFKVPSKPKPGQPAKDESYVMCEGERQDDIEVVKIDEPAGMVTFNNHGTVQELTLANAPNISAPAAAGGAGMFGGGGSVPGAGGPPMPGGSHGGRSRNMPVSSPGAASPGGNPNAAGQPNFGSPVNANGIYNPGAQPSPMDNLSPEDRAALVEINYMAARARNDPTAPLFPPTQHRGEAEALLNGGQ